MSSPPPIIPSICFNTFKGGVSKTTTAYNLGYFFTTLELKVLMLDVDPQQNLSQVFLQAFDPEIIERVCRDPGFVDENRSAPCVNVAEALGKFIKAQTIEPPAVEVLSHPYLDSLKLIPGAQDLTQYETQIAAALVSNDAGKSNLPGALFHIVQKAARDNACDIILIDTSPSMGPLNMLVIMSSTHFISPCQADFFSLNALKALHRVIFGGSALDANGDVIFHESSWVAKMRRLQALSMQNVNPLPVTTPIFLGVIVQMFAVSSGKPVKAYQSFIDQISDFLNDTLGPDFLRVGMVNHPDKYRGIPYRLPGVRNFNRFAPLAQDLGVPVMALRDHPDDLLKPLQGRMMKRAKQDLESMMSTVIEGGKRILILMDLFPSLEFSFDEDEESEFEVQMIDLTR